MKKNTENVFENKNCDKSSLKKNKDEKIMKTVELKRRKKSSENDKFLLSKQKTDNSFDKLFELKDAESIKVDSYRIYFLNNSRNTSTDTTISLDVIEGSNETEDNEMLDKSLSEKNTLNYNKKRENDEIPLDIKVYNKNDNYSSNDKCNEYSFKNKLDNNYEEPIKMEYLTNTTHKKKRFKEDHIN